MNWRWNMDFGGGQLMDWIGHHLDIAHWGMGWDETGPVEIEGTGEFPTIGHLQQPDPLLGRGASTPTGRPWSWPAATTRSGAARSGSASTAGSGSTAASSRAEPASLKQRGRSGPNEIAPLPEPRSLPELPRLRPQPGDDDRAGRDGPPLGERRAPRRRRHRDRAGRSGGTRRPRPSSAIPRRRGSSGTRTASPGSCRSEESDHEKNAHHDRGRSPRRLRVARARGRPRGRQDGRWRARRAWSSIYDSLDAILKRTSELTISRPASARRCGSGPTSSPTRTTRRPVRRPRPRFSEFIQGSPAPGGLMAACRALRLVGGPDSVPVLAALALKPETTDAARYALERIPGGEADQALVEALGKTQGDDQARHRLLARRTQDRRRGPDSRRAGRGERRRPGHGRRESPRQDRRRGGRQGRSPRRSARPAQRSSPRPPRPCFSRPRDCSQPETRPRPRRFTTRSSRPTSPRSSGRPRSRASSPPRTTPGP